MDTGTPQYCTPLRHAGRCAPYGLRCTQMFCQDNPSPLQVDAGRRVVAHKVELGYLEQTAVSGSELSVWEEARSRMTELLEAEALLDRAGHAMEAGDPLAGDLLESANDAYEAAGGPTADKKVANVLTGLGFGLEQYDKKCSEFSGGWQVCAGGLFVARSLIVSEYTGIQLTGIVLIRLPAPDSHVQMRIALARLLLSPAGQSANSTGGGGLLLLVGEPSEGGDRATELLQLLLLRSCWVLYAVVESRRPPDPCCL